MAKSNTYLDGLFEKAREEEPIASFEEIELRFSNTIASGYPGAAAGLLSKFKFFVLGVSLLTVLTTITLVFININKPLSEDIPENNKNILTRIDFQNDAEVNLSLDYYQETLPFSSSDPGNSQKAEEKSKLPSSFSRNANLVSDFELPHIPELKTNALPIKRLPIPADENQQIILSESKEFQGTAVEFTINNQTSTQKLASIASEAKRAGIDYTYVVDLKKKLIREFNVDMSIPGTKQVSTVEVSVPKKGNFEITLDWVVDDDGNAIKLTDNIFIKEAAPKHSLHLTQARKFCRIYEDKGINFLEENFDGFIKEARLKGPKVEILNTAGYLYLKQYAFDEAIEIFKLNTRIFPKKANTWDSLGEALYKNGDKPKALKAFQNALSIDPKFSSSQRWVKKIMAEQ